MYRGKRNMPNWGVLRGGPLDGQRWLLQPGHERGALTLHTPGAAPGTRVPHEYEVTGEHVPGRAGGRLGRSVRSLVGRIEPRPVPLRRQDHRHPIVHRGQQPRWAAW